MGMKRLLSALLAAVLVAALATAPAGAVSATAFTDVTDPAQVEAAEVLRVLGIVSGTGGGRFRPDDLLTRAAFCKMAVELMGNGDKVAAQSTRTIFKDVPSTHWANGYINVAASASGSGESAAPGIIRGDGSGNFNPDRPIKYSEAVTILMRVLGYSDSDVGIGAAWYSGYLSTALSIGLIDSLPAAPEAPVSRGRAALLFETLLYTQCKGASRPYITALGGEMTDEVLVVDVNATADDGSTGAVQTGSGKVYRTDRAPFSAAAEGRRAKLVLDKDGKLVAMQLSDKGSQRLVGISSAKYDALTLTGGETVKVKPATPLWKQGSQTEYKSAYLNIKAGTQALLQYSAAGELEYIFLRDITDQEEATRVLKGSTAVESGYRIYKNGVLATAADLRQYDVVTTDKATGVLYVSDLRLTGVYENASPSPDTPATITLLGHRFPVLPSAYEDLRAFKLGAQMTILLSYDGQVAGAVTTAAARSTTVGVVTELTGDTASIQPLADLRDASGAKITLTGKTSATAQIVGQLVTVSSSSRDSLTLTKVTGSGATGALNLSTGKVGRATLADNVVYYERVGDSAPIPIDPEQITRASVPADKIVYVHTDYAGRADIILLDDATGDCYEYGFALYTAGDTYDGTGPSSGEIGLRPGDKTSPDSIAVKSAAHPDGGSACTTTQHFRSGTVIGIIPALAKVSGGTPRLSASVELKSMKVNSTAFDMDAFTLTTTDAVFPVSQKVQCYNKAAGEWFNTADGDAEDALNAARAFADTLTVYYDKDPAQGGKIRLVVAE